MPPKELVEYYRKFKPKRPSIEETAPKLEQLGWSEDDIKNAYNFVFLEDKSETKSEAGLHRSPFTFQNVKSNINHPITLSALTIFVIILLFWITIWPMIHSNNEIPQDTEITLNQAAADMLEGEQNSRPNTEIIYDNEKALSVLMKWEEFNCVMSWPNRSSKSLISEEACIKSLACKEPQYEFLVENMSENDKFKLVKTLDIDPYAYEYHPYHYYYKQGSMTTKEAGDRYAIDMQSKLNYAQEAECMQPFIQPDSENETEKLRILLYKNAWFECGKENNATWSAANTAACWENIHCVANTLVEEITESQAGDIKNIFSEFGYSGRWDKKLLEDKAEYSKLFEEIIYPACNFR